MEQQTQTTPPAPSSFDVFLHKTGDLIRELAELTGKAAEDLTGLVLVHTDKPLRNQLDMLVEAGVAKTRSEGLRLLADAGLHVKQDIIGQVEKVRAEIDALRKGLKASLDM
jgi:hypothetical protein